MPSFTRRHPHARSGAEAIALSARLIRSNEADIVIGGGTGAAIAVITLAAGRWSYQGRAAEVVQVVCLKLMVGRSRVGSLDGHAGGKSKEQIAGEVAVGASQRFPEGQGVFVVAGEAQRSSGGDGCRLAGIKPPEPCPSECRHSRSSGRRDWRRTANWNSSGLRVTTVSSCSSLGSPVAVDAGGDQHAPAADLEQVARPSDDREAAGARWSLAAQE